jgi:hypothetical protein
MFLPSSVAPVMDTPLMAPVKEKLKRIMGLSQMNRQWAEFSNVFKTLCCRDHPQTRCIQICSGKKSGVVLDWGKIETTSSFVRTPPISSKLKNPKSDEILSFCVVPNGWKIAVIYIGHVWIFETRVDLGVQYRVSLVLTDKLGQVVDEKNGVHKDMCVGEWNMKTPSGAFKECHQKVKSVFPMFPPNLNGFNGQLLLGIMYSSVQVVLRSLLLDVALNNEYGKLSITQDMRNRFLKMVDLEKNETSNKRIKYEPQ